MEWYLILLIAVAAVFVVAMLGLHSFEFFYRRKLELGLPSSSDNFDFSAATSAASRGQSGQSTVVTANTGPSWGSTPASPNSLLTFSDSSSPASTALEFTHSSRTYLPSAPSTAHVKPSKHFISFDGLRGKETSRSDHVDIEAQDGDVGRHMKGLGW